MLAGVREEQEQEQEQEQNEQETARGDVLVVLFDQVGGRGLFTNVGCHRERVRWCRRMSYRSVLWGQGLC